MIPPVMTIYRLGILRKIDSWPANIKNNTKIKTPAKANLKKSFFITAINIGNCFFVMYSVKNLVNAVPKGENAIKPKVTKDIKALKVP